MLFDGSVDNLTLDDIQAVIDSEVEEGKSVEYKRELDIGENPVKHKKKLVGEVVSFANDDGGYVIIGVREERGIPRQADGIETDDPDAIKEQWGSIIRNNTDPELPPNVLDIGSIEVTDDNHVFVIQIDQSWRAPHRETLNNIFYGRSPSGRVELNVEEIRHRILGTEKLDKLEELKQMRDRRIELIRNREGIASALESGALTAVHVIPAAATTNLREHIPVSELPRPQPLGGTINGYDITADTRYAWTSGDDGWHAYTLINNDGFYEAVGNKMFSVWGDETMIKSKVSRSNMGLDAAIIVAVKQALTVFKELGISGPIYAFVSLLDAAEYKLDDSRGLPAEFFPGDRTISTDVFTTPPAKLSIGIDDVTADLESTIDTIYHQMSWEDGSPNYSDGKWTGGNVSIDGEQFLGE